MKRKLILLFSLLISLLCLCFGLAACDGSGSGPNADRPSDGDDEPPHVHTFTNYQYNGDATCTEDGTETGKCSCGETDTRAAVGSKLGHDWGEGVVTKEPTCSSEGERTFTCSHDANHHKTEAIEIDPDAHLWDDGVVTREPTCSAAGSKLYTCRYNEDHHREQPLDADPDRHQFGEWVEAQPAACESGGWLGYYTCQYCNRYFGEDGEEIANPFLSPLGHDWGEGVVTTEPTCISEGERTFTCSHDATHQKKESIEIDTAAHAYGDWVERKEPLCETDGYFGHYECGLCHKSFDETYGEIEQVIIPKLGHDTVHHEGVEPTCSESGLAAYDSCKRCDYQSVKEVYLPALHINYYVGEDGCYTVNQVSAAVCDHTEVTIPSTYMDKPVTVVGDYAFKGNTHLQSIHFPETLTMISYSAFEGCTGLREVTIPNSVRTIGIYVFRNCTNLETITIGSGVISIGGDAFANCSNLNKVITPDLAAWCKISFGGTTGNPLNCGNAHLYEGEREIVDLTIPTGVTKIPDDAFYCLKTLRSVEIPAGVTEIGSGAFYNCSGLERVTVGNGVKSIGNYVFMYCDGLTEVTVGSGVTEIGTNAFYGCSALKKVITPNLSDWCKIQFKSEESNPLCGGTLYEGKDALLDLTIPNGIAEILPMAFCGFADLKSVVIPDGVTAVGEYAFSGCINLTSVTVGKGVTSFGDQAFAGCSLIGKVTADLAAWCKIDFREPEDTHDKFTSNPLWGGKASLYQGEQKLADLTIPDGVTEIMPYAFYQCQGLESVVIGDGVTAIGKDAFYVTQLSSLTLGKSVRAIGNFAFTSCSSLASLELPEGLESIGSYAFYECRLLGVLNLPNSVTSVGECAFGRCRLNEVTVGRGVVSIGNDAFSECTSIKKVTTPDLAAWAKIEFGNESSNPLYPNRASFFVGDAELNSLTALPEGITEIGQFAFAGCKSLKSVGIPSGVTAVGPCAFEDCRLLADVTLGGVTELGFSAFYGCKNLTNVKIAGSFTEIGKNTFSGCTLLAELSLPESVTSIGENAINYTNIETIRYNGTIDAWKAIDKAYGWDGRRAGKYTVICTDGTISPDGTAVPSAPLVGELSRSD